MLNNLKKINRIRIQDKRDKTKCLYLNRAERVEPIEIKENIFNFNNLGFYYDICHLYKKLSKYLNANINQILITNGAEEAIRYIFNILIKKNDTVMFPIPTYGMYHIFCDIYSVNKILLDYNNNFEINKNKLYENLNKIKVFFLPNPSHIEDIFLEEEIIKICNILKKNEGYLVIDETYYGFGSKTMINLINKIQNIFIIRSFSKTFGLPSIRVGCLIGNKHNINLISNYRPAYEISYPSLKIAEYFLDNINIINKYNLECIQGKKYLIYILEKNNIIYNGINNYLINIKIKNKSDEICKYLEKEYIYVKNNNNYISITICPKKYIEKFINIFLKIYKELNI